MSKSTIRTLKLSVIYSTIGLFISTFFGQAMFAIATPASPPAATAQASPPTAASQPSQANPVTKYPGLAPSDYNSQGLPRCYEGGQPAPCSEVWKSIKNTVVLMLFLGVFFIIGMAGSIFSIFMIIHAANHPIEDKTAWILVMLLTSFIGGIIYYFAVKRSFDRNSHPPSLQTPLNPQPPIQPPTI